MSVIRAAVVSALVSFAAVSGASAMTVADLAHAGFGDHTARGETMRAAAQSYFDYDAVITLGALALAGGALAAFGARATRRGAGAVDEPAWRASVMRAVQADLAEFTATFRRAA